MDQIKDLARGVVLEFGRYLNRHSTYFLEYREREDGDFEFLPRPGLRFWFLPIRNQIWFLEKFEELVQLLKDSREVFFEALEEELKKAFGGGLRVPDDVDYMEDEYYYPVIKPEVDLEEPLPDYGDLELE